MPSRNIVKEYIPEAFYHVYNRGVEKRTIFFDEYDYVVFLGLLKKYLGSRHRNPRNRHKFDNLANEIQLSAYCLMPNHFHLLLYQTSSDGITKLMRRVGTGYAMYFNQRYQRVGSLFQGKYKASLVQSDSYLQHISRYIHLNPADYSDWPYSSLACYLGKKQAAWVNPTPILESFDRDTEQYSQFLSDYRATSRENKLLKQHLANGDELL